MHQRMPTPTPVSRRAFTLTELLVAIGIIVLLVGLLLPALGKALQRAKVTQTQSTMQEFSKACDSFMQEFGYYPGVVPEDFYNATAAPPISGTENAMLHLMGGAVRQDDPMYASLTPAAGWTIYTFGTAPNTFEVKINPQEIGKGPRVNGKQYPPIYTPKPAEIGAVVGQVGESAIAALPDLKDAWGQPIIFLRSMRASGPMVGVPSATVLPQFTRKGALPYLQSTALGEASLNQSLESILQVATITATVDSDSSLGLSAFDRTLGQIIRNPGLGAKTIPCTTGTARGRYFLLSAGPDAIYFSRKDGPGSAAVPVTNIVTGTYGDPKVVVEYDDLLVFGGG
ncbi:MAG: prepilin-type N-terminal cleavage/methylation domain-containing protein [Phycisphaerales bacterium]|nr:prepilin-type N-terminal cleavage/methylation domain-containing protein [Phycisphaerales bacterium]